MLIPCVWGSRVKQFPIYLLFKTSHVSKGLFKSKSLSKNGSSQTCLKKNPALLKSVFNNIGIIVQTNKVVLHSILLNLIRKKRPYLTFFKRHLLL